MSHSREELSLRRKLFDDRIALRNTACLRTRSKQVSAQRLLRSRDYIIQQ
jgi:hypothetical protein